MKTIDADKHNFGQSVEPTDRASGVWYRKPRPVYWEHLFFGKQSPIACFFSQCGENGDHPLGKYLFNLEVEIESDWLGFSKAVAAAASRTPTPEHFYAFGVLTAYAFAFGIRDLHKNNLIFTETHIQAIDAEVVLTDLILPNETILLPFKDIGFDRCGMQTLVPTLESVSTENRRQIFCGYFDLFSALYQRQEEINASFADEDLGAPIRVIVRNTRLYKEHLTGAKPILDLLDEEIIQIQRGDIPYFFKRCGVDGLWWISDRDHQEKSMANTLDFHADIARHARSPQNLIGEADSIERKMVQGAFLLQKYFGLAEILDFGWGQSRLTLGNDFLDNQATENIFRKKALSK